jgi:hypothetical protein
MAIWPCASVLSIDHPSRLGCPSDLQPHVRLTPAKPPRLVNIRTPAELQVGEIMGTSKGHVGGRHKTKFTLELSCAVLTVMIQLLQADGFHSCTGTGLAPATSAPRLPASRRRSASVAYIRGRRAFGCKPAGSHAHAQTQKYTHAHANAHTHPCLHSSLPSRAHVRAQAAACPRCSAGCRMPRVVVPCVACHAVGHGGGSLQLQLGRAELGCGVRNLPLALTSRRE